MPLLMHDISRHYQDQLVLEPDFDSVVISRNDEQVLAHCEKIATEVLDKNGQRRLQLPLP